jgi:hypothetical protein
MSGQQGAATCGSAAVGAHGAVRESGLYDGRSMSALTRMIVQTGLGFYRERGPPRGQSGAVVAVQRTSSDLKLNPGVHAVSSGLGGGASSAVMASLPPS